MSSEYRAGLVEFNELAYASALEQLIAVCAAPTWAHNVVTGRPFADSDQLFEHAEKCLRALPDSDIDQALDGHPRIGGDVRNANSAAEQAAVTGADTEVRAKLADLNADYEARFGHIYLVFASGRSGEELLQILVARLGNDAATERLTIRNELVKINRLRVARLLGQPTAS
ncbi:2-oxo-4-hydroxy-4-carboxy-5-ureidoimidazoline decarboxylase [Antrihabitans spumae]|jgi:2-oxo-4-hydroxy-4-carboxy-5-ureidoimidazoline decarboxylase|uniref:2-oxo-4-hydroxy-4-carboxy-5-ureidoimidazoline decarboxylase n=1 Tax=Antrihabitans spumae TaxID=3373370 RepID=A0ABW7KMN9_9NOCA